MERKIILLAIYLILTALQPSKALPLENNQMRFSNDDLFDVLCEISDIEILSGEQIGELEEDCKSKLTFYWLKPFLRPLNPKRIKQYLPQKANLPQRLPSHFYTNLPPPVKGA